MKMSFLVLGGLAGLAAGASLGHGFAVFGFIIGTTLGLLFARLLDLEQQVRELRRQQVLTQRPASTAVPATPSSPLNEEIAPPPTATPTSQVEQVTWADAIPKSSSASPPAGKWAPQSDSTTAAADPAHADSIERIAATIKRWFTDGNVPVKVGVMVLFAGIGALLRYAQHQGWLRMPIGMRLCGLALAASAALAFGWRERTRRRSFALAIQGGAIGILLMTVFGAFRLYHLLPAGLSLALMLVLVAATCGLALVQESIALAVLALLAGFAAPILSSTGQGSHVALFSYYALFNVAIFAMAWLRSWRLLNLLGFAFTFLIGIAWGVLRYEPQQFDSTEPFLVLFFAIYVAIPVCNGLRQTHAQRAPVDGTLVFGNPLLAFSLQAGLMEGARMPLAGCALALTGLYALLAWFVLRRHRVLGESFVVLAAAFATLSVPLALSAWATACVFALEGAGLLWLGFRQQQRLQRWSGLALQGLAALAYVYSLRDGPVETHAVLNSSYLSALLIAGAGFASAWLHLKHREKREHTLLLYFWGIAWWCGAGWREVERFVAHAIQTPAGVAFMVLTALLAAIAWYPLKSKALAWTAALALAMCLLQVWGFALADLRPWQPVPLSALAFLAVGGFAALRLLRDAPAAAAGVAHSSWTWTWTSALALTGWQLAADADLGNGWRDALTLLPLLAAWALAVLRPLRMSPPLQAQFDHWRKPLCTSQAIVAGGAWLLTLFSPDNTAPLPWLPILNPLELLQLAVLFVAGSWLVELAPARWARGRTVLLTLGGFLFATSATLRGVHQLGDVPWDEELWSSVLAQTALTIVWSVLGVVSWILGSRRGSRPLWLGGAVLMAVVLAKLLLVDRTHLGSVLGIVSFIAYGLLCTVIGYLAPAPPRTAAAGISGASAG